MIVRDFNKIVEHEKDRVVSDANWTSVRMLLADDKMGFSFHITFLEEGSEHTFEYPILWFVADREPHFFEVLRVSYGTVRPTKNRALHGGDSFGA